MLILSYLVFSDLACHLEDTRIGVLWLHCATYQETELESRNQEASPSAGKNIGSVWIGLVLCCEWKCVPTTISIGVDISEVPSCHLLLIMSSQSGSQKLLQRSVFHEFTVYPSDFGLFLTQ